MGLGKQSCFRARILPALLSLAALAGCISFGEDPPPFMLTLTADQPVAAGPARVAASSQVLVVDEVAVPNKLNTLRVPVARGGNTVAYLKEAFWVERPNRLFQKLLAETVSARSDRPVLTPEQAGVDAGARLEGELVDFGLDGPALQVVVTFDAIVRDGTGQLRKRRFEAREDVPEAEAAPVGEALNVAANRVAGEVADWFVAQ